LPRVKDGALFFEVQDHVGPSIIAG
jgi:hypothetical protein